MKTTRSRFLATVALIVVSSWVNVAIAIPINLVTNGDFEADGGFASPPSGWGTSGAGNFVDAAFHGYTPFGSFALYMGCIAQLCGSTQTIATTPGAIYNFEFEYGSDGHAPNEFIARFDGATMFHTTDDFTDTRPGFIHKSFIVTASTSSTLIDFQGNNNPGWQALDNVSVTAVSGVPEPSSLALLGSGLAVLAALRRRKTKTA